MRIGGSGKSFALVVGVAYLSTFATATVGAQPASGAASSARAPAFAKEAVFSRHDDWEPTIAADDAGHVYMLTTRFGAKPACAHCPNTFIALKRSMNGGATWLSDQYLCRCQGMNSQYDPGITVDDTGRVFATWLQGYKPGVMFARSDDFGMSWTTAAMVASPTVSWSDKPWMATSTDGNDVYIFFNGKPRGTPYVATSTNAGSSWNPPVPMQHQGHLARYYFASGATVLPDGDVLTAQTAYRQKYSEGRVLIYVYRSTDGGVSFQRTTIASGSRGPLCPSWSGCGDGYFGSQIAIAGDDSNNAYILYNAGHKPRGPARVYFVKSSDSGASWTDQMQLSKAPGGADHDFPMIAADASGVVSAAWMDHRTGLWNTWYRESGDGGASWGPEEKLSNRSSGAPYKSRHGFAFPYGDYGNISIGDGNVWAIWGESRSYIGPGGSWYTSAPD